MFVSFKIFLSKFNWPENLKLVWKVRYIQDKKKNVIIYGITFPYMQVFHIQLILQKNNTENADTMIDINYKS